MDIENQEMIIKNKNCQICKEALDYYNDNIVLVKCDKCPTIYHKDCWEILTKKKCVQCKSKSVSDYNTDFFINELWED